jgi:hypothetical protein
MSGWLGTRSPWSQLTTVPNLDEPIGAESRRGGPQLGLQETPRPLSNECSIVGAIPRPPRFSGGGGGLSPMHLAAKLEGIR